MTLPASGQIDFSDINVELGLVSTAQLSLGASNVRTLLGVASGPIRLGADGYGKSAGFNPGGATTVASSVVFNFTNTAESFTFQGATSTNFASYIYINSTSTDPIMRRTTSFSGYTYRYIDIAIFRGNGSSWDGTVYYSTAGHGESASYRKSFPQPAFDGVNWQYITIDMWALDFGGLDWYSNIITNLRLDFGASATDDFYIDYIQLRTNLNPAAGLYGTRYIGYMGDGTTMGPPGTTDNVNFANTFALQGDVNQISQIDAFTSSVPPADADYYSWEWRGYFLAPTTGTYTFTTTSDDASYVWIGSNAISGLTIANSTVNNGGLHGPVNVTSGNIALTAGNYYPFRVQFSENTVGDIMTLSFTGPGIASTTDGTGYFFYNANSNGF